MSTSRNALDIGRERERRKRKKKKKKKNFSSAPPKDLGIIYDPSFLTIPFVADCLKGIGTWSPAPSIFLLTYIFFLFFSNNICPPPPNG
jgi:hypothetical protein